MGVPTTISVRALALTCWITIAIQAGAQMATPGTVVAWGDNSAGQTNVPPTLTNAIAVAGGGAFSVALDANGTVTAWGDNSFGQTNVPVSLSNVVAISAGYAHALALKADGTVMAWGKDDLGQANVPLDLTNAVAVAAGRSHSLALRADGTVVAWGDNSFHQTDVPLSLSNAVAISAGGYHSVALKSDGSVIAWGDDRLRQTNVPSGLNGVIAIAAGDFYTLASRSDGRVIAWPNNDVPVGLTMPSAAIISPNAGITDTSVTKFVAENGNVVINGTSSGPIVVDGNAGFAVFANGRVNYNTNYLNPPPSAYSMTNAYTVNEIPDYTWQSNACTLYDINRLIAVADATPNGCAPSGNNHFADMSTFISAAKTHPPANPMQGVVVVDVSTNNYVPTLAIFDIPNGINITGTLLFNFLGSGWTPTGRKIVVTTAVNVNPADLSQLVATNPATYTSGYPPTYTDPSKNPVNINIAPVFTNFTASEDLPALVYTTSVLDLHGPLNISGNVYTPSYVEIENKQVNQTQYIKGSVIMGNGFFYENISKGSISIISCQPRAAMAWIAAGAGHNLALRSDGALFSWGNLAPSPPPGLSNVVAVAASGSHNLALIGNGPPIVHAPLVNAQSGSGGFTVSAPTQSGRVYALEHKTSLGDSGWTALPLVAGDGGVVTFLDPAATDAQRFYRLRQW